MSLIAWPLYICDETKLAAASAEARYFGSAVNSKRCADSLHHEMMGINKLTVVAKTTGKPTL